MGNVLQGSQYRLGGLTLLECLITLAVVATLMSIGVPAYRDQLASARARAGAQQLYAAMQYARSMAQLGGSVITLCPVIDPSEKLPQCGGHFWSEHCRDRAKRREQQAVKNLVAGGWGQSDQPHGFKPGHRGFALGPAGPRPP